MNREINLSGIKHVILDFGGGILNIDYQAPVRAFAQLGISDFNDLFSQAKQTNLFDNYEKGLISDELFIDTIRNIAGIALSDQQIIDAWNSILLDLPKPRLELIHRLKTDFNTFLLSNTNALHISSFEQNIDKSFGLDYFYKAFNKIYYSCQIRMRKPDEEIFRYVLRENSLNAGETLFIDDSIQHIGAAKAMGIRTFHLQQGREITHLFPNIKNYN